MNKSVVPAVNDRWPNFHKIWLWKSYPIRPQSNRTYVSQKLAFALSRDKVIKPFLPPLSISPSSPSSSIKIVWGGHQRPGEVIVIAWLTVLVPNLFSASLIAQIELVWSRVFTECRIRFSFSSTHKSLTCEIKYGSASSSLISLNLRVIIINMASGHTFKLTWEIIWSPQIDFIAVHAHCDEVMIIITGGCQ